MAQPTPSASNARDGGRPVLWDPALHRTSPLFAPLAPAFEALAAAVEGDAFPPPEVIDAALGPRAGVRFERQRPSRRRRQPKDPELMYDARIERAGCVPTRPGSWHDLMNALVWATFPRAKRALHARQLGLVVRAAPGESTRRPRELDALAMLDEGGVVVASAAPLALATEAEVALAIARSEAVALVFGHAIFEGLALGRPAPRASVVCLAARGEALDPRAYGSAGAVREVDGALAAVVADRARMVDPRTTLRVRVDAALAPWK